MTPKERRELFASLYRSGLTLQQIGDEHGITRERVRQLLSKVGLVAKDGGCAIRVSRKRAIAAKRADEKCLARTGFTVAQYELIPRPILRAYKSQRHSADSRGVAWRMNLREWMRVWEDSGKWNERGRGREKFCMARIDDLGPYAASNVKIITNRENTSEYAVAKLDGIRKNRMTVSKGVYHMYPGCSRPFVARIAGRMTFHATAADAIQAREAHRNALQVSKSFEAPESSPCSGIGRSS